MFLASTGTWNYSEIESLVQSFQAGSLPRCKWTHHAHLIVALWYLLNYPESEATNRIRYGIQRYNRLAGIKNTPENGYHETLTLFWVKLVSRHLAEMGTNHSLEYLANHLIQTCGNSSFILQYYSRDLLMSYQARITWVEPDLQPLEN